ncbi:MAG: hypothetical protein ACLPY1_04375 [Terracidiphilus sp.]
MTYPMMQHIPLRSAYLCQDCNCVGNCAVQCPACASAVLMNLACVLDRDSAREEKPVADYGKYPAVVDICAMVA